MAIEEKVIQPESVTNAEQPMAETPSQAQPPIEAIKKQYEDQITVLKKQLSDNEAHWSENFMGRSKQNCTGKRSADNDFIATVRRDENF